MFHLPRITRFVYSLPLLFLTRTATADIIQFDPDGVGGGGTYSVGSFDFLQGNSLSEDVILGGAGHEWTLYFQASLGSLVNGSGGVIAGTGVNSSYEITAVAAISVRTIGLSPGSLAFERAANPAVNFMRLYYDSNVNANPLAGTGYNDGTLILDSSAETDLAGFFLFTSMNAGALDQFNTNNWPGISTVGGIGAFSSSADISYADSNFFVGGPSSLVDFIFANTSEIVPFRQTDPSVQFWNGSSFVTSTIGTLNGISGPDVILQADANASFTVVPEASSMMLAGLGAVFASAIAWKRRRQSV